MFSKIKNKNVNYCVFMQEEWNVLFSDAPGTFNNSSSKRIYNVTDIGFKCGNKLFQFYLS